MRIRPRCGGRCHTNQQDGPLEHAGLVRRAADGDDRRRTVVHITDVAIVRLRPLTLNSQEARMLAQLDDVAIQELAHAKV